MVGAGPCWHIHSWEQQTKSPSVSQKTCVSGFVRVTDRRLHGLSGHKASVWIPGPQTPPSACKWEGKSIKQSLGIFPWSFGNVVETPFRENTKTVPQHMPLKYCLFMHLIIVCVWKAHVGVGGPLAGPASLLSLWGSSGCIVEARPHCRLITLEPYSFFFFFLSLEAGSHSG